MTESGDVGTAYTSSSTDTYVYSIQDAGNSLTGVYASDDSSTDEGSQTTSGVATDGSSFTGTVTNDSQDGSQSAGNSLTGAYTSTVTNQEDYVTTETSTQGAYGFTLSDQQQSQYTRLETGNSISGDYSATQTGTASENLQQAGSNAAGAYQVNTTTSDSPTVTITGNSLSGLYASVQTGAIGYTYDEVITGTGNDFSIDGSGTQTYTRTDNYDTNTGDPHEQRDRHGRLFAHGKRHAGRYHLHPGPHRHGRLHDGRHEQRFQRRLHPHDHRLRRLHAGGERQRRGLGHDRRQPQLQHGGLRELCWRPGIAQSSGAACRIGAVWVWQRLLAGVGKPGESPGGLVPVVAVRPRRTGPRWAGNGRQDDWPDHLPMRPGNVGPADRRTDAMTGPEVNAINNALNAGSKAEDLQAPRNRSCSRHRRRCHRTSYQATARPRRAEASRARDRQTVVAIMAVAPSDPFVPTRSGRPLAGHGRAHLADQGALVLALPGIIQHAVDRVHSLGVADQPGGRHVVLAQPLGHGAPLPQGLA